MVAKILNADQAKLDVLVVDDETNIRKTLSLCLTSEGHHVVAVSNARDAALEASRRRFDLAFVDILLGHESGLDLIPELLGQSPWIKLVVVTAYGTIDSAVEAMKRGAADYLTKPFTPDQVRLVTQRVGQVRALEQRIAGLQARLGETATQINFKSASAAMQRAIEMARQVAKSDATVLFRGQSGTGKSVLARAIHLWSDRADKPFATVSCPSLSPQLLESELFGHVKGAFTGAMRENPGRLSATEGGTLFLDEIGDLPIELQPKLLRFLQDRQYERVGDSLTRQADVRVLTATNVDLDQAVRAGEFRQDLLYRINVMQIDLPSLHQRQEDIPELAERFLAEVGTGKSGLEITPAAMAALRDYPWPGNIRELRNVIERALILSPTGRIDVEHLPETLQKPSAASENIGDLIPLEKLEEMHIRRVLAKTPSLDDAANILGIDSATLWRKRKKYGI